VARAIIQSLRNVPWVAIVSQDSFYKSLTPEQSKLAFENNYDFDHPDAFDYDILWQCIQDLKQSRAVEIPVYSFVEHQRTKEKKYMYGASVIILEGIFVLHDPAIRNLLDLKIYVQADSDLMLARRIRRDTLERGRDVQGILDQYLRFVKPSMDNFVQPTSKHADIIVPGQNNAVAIDVICQQIRRQLELRDDIRLRHALSKTPATPRSQLSAAPFSPLPLSAWHSAGSFMPTSVAESNQDVERPARLPMSRQHSFHPLENQLPPNIHVLSQTTQLHALLTILHDVNVTGEDFVFTVDRLAMMVMEQSMAFLPYKQTSVCLSTNKKRQHVGMQLDVQDICSVAILRSGTVLESSARRVLPALARGTILIQSQADGEARLYTLDLPRSLKNRQSASKAWVLVLDSQIGTGAAALMAIRVLIDHGVREEHILFCCLLVSVKGGVHALHRAFPRVRIVVAGVDPDLKRRVVTEHSNAKSARSKIAPVKVGHRPRALADMVAYNEADDYHDDKTNNQLSSDTGMTRSRICFAICPGAGNIGDRYFGTSARSSALTADAS
jgi:uridine kinase